MWENTKLATSCHKLTSTWKSNIQLSMSFLRKVDEINIRKYREDDYEDVRRIFTSSRVAENTKNGIVLGLQNQRVVGFLTVMFALGSIQSLVLGIFILFTCLLLHSLLIYLLYALHVRWVFVKGVIWDQKQETIMMSLLQESLEFRYGR